MDETCDCLMPRQHVIRSNQAFKRRHPQRITHLLGQPSRVGLMPSLLWCWHNSTTTSTRPLQLTPLHGQVLVVYYLISHA